MNFKTIGVTIAVGFAVGAVTAGSALAEYPERSIQMMIPFAAGGGTDVPGRFFAAEMEKILDANIIVSNVTGAGGTVGATQLSNADADGYSLGFMPVGTTTTQPHLKRTKYNADSWVPICMVSQGPFYLVVQKDSSVKSVEDYIAKAKSDGLKFAGAGPGSMAHVSQLTLDKKLGVKTRYIPTKGGGAIATEIDGGRADATTWFSDFDSKFGWRALAILDSNRSDAHPDVPTLTELGYDVNVSVWFGFFAPAGTPDDVIGRLSEACEQAVSTDAFKANMAKANRAVVYKSTAEFSPFFREAFKLNGELLKEAGLIK